MITYRFSLVRPADDGVYNRVDNEPLDCSQAFGDCPRDPKKHDLSFLWYDLRLKSEYA